MNKHRSCPGRRALREAERWLARRLDEDFSDHAALQAWLDRDTRHALAWQQVWQRWDELGLLLQDERFSSMAASALDESGGRKRWIDGRAGWLTATAAALMVVVVLALAGRNLYPQATNHVTGAEARSVLLADGSRVKLDYHSHIRSRMNWRQRRIELLEGRALFEVAPESARRFVVQAGDARIVATGTSFQVDHSGKDVSVSLLSGQVQVSARSNTTPTRMEPGTRLRWEGTKSGWARTSVDVEAVTAWTRGFLQFNDTPLSEAVSEMNRYARRPIDLLDAELGALPVSGTFKRGDSARFASALEYVLPVTAEAEGERIVVMRR